MDIQIKASPNNESPIWSYPQLDTVYVYFYREIENEEMTIQYLNPFFDFTHSINLIDFIIHGISWESLHFALYRNFDINYAEKLDKWAFFDPILMDVFFPFLPKD